MLVGYRNTILSIGVLLTALFFVLMLLSGYDMFANGIVPENLNLEKANTWWFTYKAAPENMYIWSVISIFTLLLLSLISSLILRHLFKKTASPELFFFTIFLLSFSFESFRILNLFFLGRAFSPRLLLLSTRIVYFGRIFGIMTLLCSSLFAVEIKYQKFDIMLGISAIIAFFMAYFMPVDSSILLTNFLYRLGDETALFMLSFSFAFFILLNFLIASFKRQGRFFYLVAATLIILLGREMLLFMTNPTVIVSGLALIISGIILFSRQIDKIYLWS